jgi:arginine decarboxylase
MTARSDGVVEISPTQAYNSWWQFRSDGWSRLEETSGRLANGLLRGVPADGMVEATSELLDGLAPLEQYWAFPGPEAFGRATDLLASGSYDRFARLVARINRALVTESYRSGSEWLLADGDHEQAKFDGAAADRAAPARPYFEVLVVETLTRAQERDLREEVRSWRRPDDEFIYELVVVGSGEEAVIAARLNASLQACVIRRRFAHASARDLSGLAHFADRGIGDELADKPPEERAQILARKLARLRPELDLYLMTEIAVEDMAGRLSHHFRRVFHAREGSLELHLSILGGVAERYRAPFFEALREYSHRPTGVFHALPISGGKSIVSSHWISDMVGEPVVAADRRYARLASRWLVVAPAHRSVGSGCALPLGHPSAGLGEAVTDSDGPLAEGVVLSAGRSPVLGAPCRAVTRWVTRPGYMVDLGEGSSRRSRPCHLSMCA